MKCLPVGWGDSGKEPRKRQSLVAETDFDGPEKSFNKPHIFYLLIKYILTDLLNNCDCMVNIESGYVLVIGLRSYCSIHNQSCSPQNTPNICEKPLRHAPHFLFCCLLQCHCVWFCNFVFCNSWCVVLKKEIITKRRDLQITLGSHIQSLGPPF